MANRVPVGTPTPVTSSTPSSPPTGAPFGADYLLSPPQKPASPGVKPVPQPESTAQAQPTTDSRGQMSQMTAAQLKQQLETISAQLNPLDQFLNVNYRFRFFMTNDFDFIANLLNTGKSDRTIMVQEVLKAIDQTAQVTIAESGVTSGINIEEVRMEQVVGPSDRARNTNMTSMSMVINEPLGTSFMEIIRNAALDLQVRNLEKCPYFVELTFLGYEGDGDHSGAIVKNVLSEAAYDNGGRWIYQVSVAKMDVELESSGSRYTLTLVPWSEDIFNKDCWNFPAPAVCSGTTIQDFLKGKSGLEQALNKAWKDLYGYEVYTYEFVLHEINNLAGQPPGMWKMMSNDSDFESSSNWSWTGGQNPSMSIYSGANIGRVIDNLFASTRRAAEIAKDVQKKSEVDAIRKEIATNSDSKMPEQQSTAELFRKALTFRVEPEVIIGDFDVYLNDYHAHIKFHIWGYYSQQPIISRAQEENAQDDGVQALMLSDLVQRGFFQRKYNYLFTGLNTEVLRLDIRYDLGWVAVLPTIALYGTNIEQASTQALKGFSSAQQTRDSYQSQAEKLNATNNSIQQISDAKAKAATTAQQQGRTLQNSDTVTLADGSTMTVSEADAQLKKLNQDKATLQQSKDALQAQMQKLGSQMHEQNLNFRKNITHKTGYSAFAEDLTQPKFSTANANDPLPLMIAYRQAKNGELKNQTGTGFQEPVSGDRGIYGAILEQLYGPITGGLINIEMEIRGDPFWLSYTDIERRVHQNGNPPPLSPSTNMPNYYEGDNVVLLNFDYPYNINAETGDINIRQNNGSTRKDRFVGMYRITRVVHAFSGGEFRQTLTGIRYTLLDVSKALGYSGIVNSGVAQNGSSGLSGSKNPPASTGSSSPTSNSGNVMAGVDPRMQALTTRAQAISAANGVPFVVTSGRAGRAQVDPTSNNSPHYAGIAVDVHPVDANGQVNWGSDGASYQAPTQQYQTINDAYSQASEELGIPYRWGGASSTFIHGGNTQYGNGFDAEHFDLGIGTATPGQIGGPYPPPPPPPPGS